MKSPLLSALILLGMVSCAKKDVINIQDLHNPYFSISTVKDQGRFFRINDTYRNAASPEATYTIKGAIDLSSVSPLPARIKYSLVINKQGHYPQIVEVEKPIIPFTETLYGPVQESAPVSGKLQLFDEKGILLQDIAFDTTCVFKIK